MHCNLLQCWTLTPKEIMYFRQFKKIITVLLLSPLFLLASPIKKHEKTKTISKKFNVKICWNRIMYLNKVAWRSYTRFGKIWKMVKFLSLKKENSFEKVKTTHKILTFLSYEINVSCFRNLFKLPDIYCAEFGSIKFYIIYVDFKCKEQT